MDEAGFGVLVTAVAAIVLMTAVGVFLAFPHDMIIQGANAIYQNFSDARNNMGL